VKMLWVALEHVDQQETISRLREFDWMDGGCNSPGQDQETGPGVIREVGLIYADRQACRWFQSKLAWGTSSAMHDFWISGTTAPPEVPARALQY